MHDIRQEATLHAPEGLGGTGQCSRASVHAFGGSKTVLISISMLTDLKQRLRHLLKHVHQRSLSYGRAAEAGQLKQGSWSRAAGAGKGTGYKGPNQPLNRT